MLLGLCQTERANPACELRPSKWHVLPCHVCLLQVTYQQQQSALQQQRQAEAALAAAAEAQEAACQDAWIVCMLVELLGSCLITPASTAAVHIPPPGSSRVQPAASSSWGTGQPDDDTSSGRYCRWERGYRFVEGGLEAASLAEVSHSGSGRVGSSCSSSNSGGLTGSASSVAAGCPLDLLNASITYPQFVEVLLCLMATRAVSILEPDVKQISPLAMDKEMEVCPGAVLVLYGLSRLREHVHAHCWLNGAGVTGAAQHPQLSLRPFVRQRMRRVTQSILAGNEAGAWRYP